VARAGSSWGERLYERWTRGPKKPNLLQKMKFSKIFADTSNARSFGAGTSIFEQGDKAGEMYVVKEGEVDIFIDGFHSKRFPPMASSAN
jgi:Cyclic nucleotide-binding domain